jgi:hypothetical protein
MEITANAIQTVAAGANVLFTDEVTTGNCSIIHRDGSGLVTLRGLTTQCRARFRVSFGGNVAVPTGGTVGPVTFALAINGEPVATTTMISTPTAVEEYHNVFTAIFLDVPRDCCMQVSVRNVGTDPVEIQNANLIVERVA